MAPILTTTPQRTLHRLQRARAGLFAVAVIFCALLALAAPTRAPRPRRPLKVQQPQQGTAHPGSKSKSGSRSGNRSGKKPPTDTESSKSSGRSHRAIPHATPHAAPHGRRRPDDDNPDPATMVRTRQHRGGRGVPRLRVRVALQPPVSAVKARRRAAALQSAQLAASIEAGVLRSRAQAQEQAHAKPSAPVAHSAWAPVEASVQPPAPVVRMPPAGRLPPRRVDGFGAEGAVLSASSVATESPAPTASPLADDPALEALAHPSRSELAEEAVQPEVLPRIDFATGRLLMPEPLRGSHEVLVHQNTMADDEGLSRIRSEAELNRLRGAHLLVDFPVSASLHLNPDLPANRRCARPWTVRFAADIAQAFYARFRQPLQVNSAVRTVAYQLRLQRSNGNAAAVEGEAASPHLTGQAIDFGKRGMSAAQLAWMRAALLPLMASGKIDVEEEFQQACFHISVYRSYLPPPRKRAVPRTEVAQLHRVE